MSNLAPASEAWLSGPVEGIDPWLQPVAHALQQAREDMTLLPDLAPERAWARPGGAASVAFHVGHLAGATDRLFTYARGETLSDDQKAALRAESSPAEPRPSLAVVVTAATAVLDRALLQLRSIAPDRLLDERRVGRAGLPSNVLGLLFHAAEHATRHVGQAITTAKILAGS